MDDGADIAALLGAALRRDDRSAAWLARRLAAAGSRVTPQGVRAWLRRRRIPRDDVRPALAAALGLDLADVAAACARAAVRRPMREGAPHTPSPEAP